YPNYCFPAITEGQDCFQSSLDNPCATGLACNPDSQTCQPATPCASGPYYCPSGQSPRGIPLVNTCYCFSNDMGAKERLSSSTTPLALIKQLSTLAKAGQDFRKQLKDSI
ncbi:MAG TPA: hypothetical protein VJJ81_01220, partial [Candidatus Babeliales bacterium]|nr:hypothetical protein [Candidatus Babeliales bacterium]